MKFSRVTLRDAYLCVMVFLTYHSLLGPCGAHANDILATPDSSGVTLTLTQKNIRERSVPTRSPSFPGTGVENGQSTGENGGAREENKNEEQLSYAVASVDFHRVQTPFIIALWIFCASLAKIGFHMAPKLNTIFPESCLLIVVGVLIGLLLLATGISDIQVSTLTPETFFFYMLPPIILDAGYFMPNKLFFGNLGTILLFAVIGTIYNMITVGTSLWAVGLTGVYGKNISVLDTYLFSSLISAVDPVAVLAVFEAIHVNEVLYIVVFGESLLNDAVTVVLYHMFETYTDMGAEQIRVRDYLAGFASFFVVALGGTLVGIIWGYLTSFVTRFTNHVRVIEPIFIFVMAYLSYLNAEIFHMSGILAITFCGITMKNYVEANISIKSHTTVKYAMKMLSSSSETIIFMFLGVATVHDDHDWNWWFVFFTILFCTVYRTIGVIIFAALANHFRVHQLKKVDKFVMCYGGLRGAVAFALVLLINKDVVEHQPMFVTTTIAVIYFTVFVQGITIKPLVKILRVKTAEKRRLTMNERIHERYLEQLMAGIEDLLGRYGHYNIRDQYKHFDNKFIRPCLIRNFHKIREPKILETYDKITTKEAMDFIKKNSSTLANVSGLGAESLAHIVRNYTLSNMGHSGVGLPHTDSYGWNLDMQELEYYPSKKDMTDARIHHLLSEEMYKTTKKRKWSYSRHTVNDQELNTHTVNYKAHCQVRRMMSENIQRQQQKKLKRNVKSGSPEHKVTFHENRLTLTENGSAKQLQDDNLHRIIQEEEQAQKTVRINTDDNIDSAITFTARKDERQVKEAGTYDNEAFEVTEGENEQPSSLTLVEKVLPWKREDERDVCTVPRKQTEFPPWLDNKEYTAYHSLSSTFLNGMENSRHPSVIGLFKQNSSDMLHSRRWSINSKEQPDNLASRGPSNSLVSRGTSSFSSKHSSPTSSRKSSQSSIDVPKHLVNPTRNGGGHHSSRGSMVQKRSSSTSVTIPEENEKPSPEASKKPSQSELQFTVSPTVINIGQSQENEETKDAVSSTVIIVQQPPDSQKRNSTKL